MEKPVVGHWYEGKSGKPRRVREVEPLGSFAYIVRYETLRGTAQLCWSNTWNRWVVTDLGPDIPPQPKTDKEQLAREHKAFPLLVKALQRAMTDVQHAQDCPAFDFDAPPDTCNCWYKQAGESLAVARPPETNP